MARVYQAKNPNFGLPAVFPDPAWPDDFEPVANIEEQPTPEQTLELAYRLTNNIDTKWVDNERFDNRVRTIGSQIRRSTSVGDIVVLDDGRTYKCENVGWKQLTSDQS